MWIWTKTETDIKWRKFDARIIGLGLVKLMLHGGKMVTHLSAVFAVASPTLCTEFL